MEPEFWSSGVRTDRAILCLRRQGIPVKGPLRRTFLMLGFDFVNLDEIYRGL